MRVHCPIGWGPGWSNGIKGGKPGTEAFPVCATTPSPHHDGLKTVEIVSQNKEFLSLNCFLGFCDSDKKSDNQKCLLPRSGIYNHLPKENCCLLLQSLHVPQAVGIANTLLLWSPFPLKTSNVTKKCSDSHPRKHPV
jgi:hypothetical protein